MAGVRQGFGWLGRGPAVVLKKMAGVRWGFGWEGDRQGQARSGTESARPVPGIQSMGAGPGDRELGIWLWIQIGDPPRLAPT
eukprot:scaffold12349_cov87-Isochrysis_galbana.AAC.3